MKALSQTKIQQLTLELERLIRRTPTETSRIKDFYVFSYPHLLAGEGRRVEAGCWTVEEVARRFTSVYGWMPCSPKSHNEAAIEQLVGLLNADASLEALMPVASSCLSNSLVAASKFIHWERPTTAPMFDSNLEAAYWPETTTRLAYLPTAVRRYLEWAAAIQAVAPELKERAQRWALATFGYEVSAVRAIEAMAFYLGRGKSSPGAVPFPQAA
ncbi:hypothetical protein P5W99_10930 [Paraburkholderia sp. A3BS-1L]|uniref:hypothetical protein n=1 Tax=Paraburkholderia sp. A3BS-1L TaxID=3028375 RepID=UPI003DA9A496